VLITCHQIPHNLMDSYLTYKKRKENDWKENYYIQW
jgi:hypothetical protein